MLHLIRRLLDIINLLIIDSETEVYLLIKVWVPLQDLDDLVVGGYVVIGLVNLRRYWVAGLTLEYVSTMFAMLIFVAALHDLTENHPNTPDIGCLVILFAHENDLWSPVISRLDLRSKRPFLFVPMPTALVKLLCHFELEF